MTSTTDFVVLQVRVPAELANDIDRIAETEARAAGLGRITRSDVLRRAVAAEVAAHAPARPAPAVRIRTR